MLSLLFAMGETHHAIFYVVQFTEISKTHLISIAHKGFIKGYKADDRNLWQIGKCMKGAFFVAFINCVFPCNFAAMQAVIRNIIQETPSVRRLELVFSDLTIFEFQAGQFVVIRFGELPEGNNERSYSISSAPEHSNRIEICVVLNPGGALTPLLWNKSVGDTLEISEAKGTFCLPEKCDTEIAFICTGTGVAPFRSMLHYLLYNQKYAQKLYLIFGNRMKKDILYEQEFEALAKEFPNFYFIPVLSRQENWDGEKGYVHEVYESIFSDKRDARFYVCGWQAMCTEARQRLKAMGYNRRQYFFEEYG